MKMQDEAVDTGTVLSPEALPAGTAGKGSVVTLDRKRVREATPKEKLFVQHLISNPKATKTDALKAAYNIKPDTKKQSMYTQASAISRKPAVISELAKYSNLVENTLIGTINEWGTSEKERRRELAINSAMFVHDKIFGKATQKIHQQTEVLNISIDLTKGGQLESASKAPEKK